MLGDAKMIYDQITQYQLNLNSQIQAQVDAEKKKAWEKEFIASRPQIAAGTGDTKTEDDPFLKGFNSVKSF